RKQDAQPFRLAWDGVAYLVGPNVHRFARPIARMDFLRLSDGPEIRALVYTALGQLLGPGAHTIHLMIGAPVEALADQQTGRQMRAGLRSWLVGEHAFTLDGVETVVRVAHKRDVQVMAQPAGAFFAWGMDDTGQWRQAVHTLEAQVAICDLGFNTLDVFSVRGGQVDARYTGG
ncbi:MAG: hypothetical protein GY797_20335, partial [Deltaproteobacteria bacterium]|nr:hypothetical protein [Deltaproteobacteria bacterium]